MKIYGATIYCLDIVIIHKRVKHTTHWTSYRFIHMLNVTTVKVEEISSAQHEEVVNLVQRSCTRTSNWKTIGDAGESFIKVVVVDEIIFLFGRACPSALSMVYTILLKHQKSISCLDM